MGVRPGFWQYIKAAFNARPIGMFVAPNWIGLAAFGLLGYAVDPGFWVLGAGLELGYLSMLATNARFQRLVAGSASAGGAQFSGQKVQQALACLSPNDKERYRLVEIGCQSILQLQFQSGTDAPGYRMQAESLGRLTWMYLRLLVTRQTIQNVLLTPAQQPRPGEPRRNTPPPLPTMTQADGESRLLQGRLADLRARLEDQTLTEDLRRSLSSQADLIQQRIDRRATAANKLAYIDAELTRIEQQVELIREQAVLSTDPESFSQKIDEIGATLSGTGEWIAEQQRALGAMNDLLETSAISSGTRQKERQ